jgi:erythromycin esterase
MSPIFKGVTKVMRDLRLLFFMRALLAVAGPRSAIAADDLRPVVEWIGANAIRLSTASPSAGNDDLRPLKTVVGDARIVSLGESIHGTREHFQLKHRMLKFLVEEMGFTLFGIESGFPSCLALNEFVLGGEGDAEEIVGKQTHGVWDTREVMELVRWMRRYNDNPAHIRKVKFYGFDMQENLRALEAALPYLNGVARDRAEPLGKRLYALIRPSLYVVRIEVSTSKEAVGDDRSRHIKESRREAETTNARIKSGELTITTTFEANARYTHELRSKARPDQSFTESGTWALDCLSGAIAAKSTREARSAIDGFRARRLTADGLVLRKDLPGEGVGAFELFYLERGSSSGKGLQHE